MNHHGDRRTEKLILGQRLWLVVPLLTLLGVIKPLRTVAQFIVPAPDGTGTQLIQANQQITINGGQRSPDGRNLFHSFTEFGLTAGQTATFLSDPTVQTILTRVNGGNPSLIDGLIRVAGGNSNFVLLNPAGILFGANARLDVPAAFLATTANRIGFDQGGWWNAVGNSDPAALNGTPTEFVFTTSTPGAIANLGNLSVSPGQGLTLIAGSILNQGEILAPGGQVTLLSVPGSNWVRLSQPGSLVSWDWPAVEAGEIVGRSLPQLLTGGALTHASQVMVNPDGSLRLAGTTTVLPTAPGTTLVSGQISVRQGDRVAPGAITVLGKNIAFINARVDASGWQGGTIRIGGETRGQGTLPNARMTTIDPASLVTANSEATTQPGQGGRVVVWADDTTRFYGTIQARGGVNGGDGGFVEVSGQQYLRYRGQTDVNAPQGQAGTLLLDPTNIVIVPGDSAPNDFELFADGQIFANEPGGTFTLSAGTLTAATGNVILEATNDITVLLPPLGDLFFSSGALSVTFNADADRDGSGRFVSPPNVSLLTAPTARTDLTIRGATIAVGDLDTSVVSGNGGNVTLVANREIQAGEINTRSRGLNGRSGDVTILSQQGQITTGNLTTEATGSNGIGGAVTVISDRGGITTGAILTRAPAVSGDVTLSALAAGRNVRFATIDAASLTGRGGNVSLEAGRFVQGTDVLPRPNRPTIDTAGAIAPGTVLIQHGGGGLSVPFGVGDGTENGTLGAITTRVETLTPPPVRSFPGSFRSPLGTIQIRTQDLPSPPEPERRLLAARPEPSKQRPVGVETVLDGKFDEFAFDLQLPAPAIAEDFGTTAADADFTAEFESYLEFGDRPTVALNAPATLQQIQAQTGIKSALIYLNFVPANVATLPPPGRDAARPTTVAWNLLTFAPPTHFPPAASQSSSLVPSRDRDLAQAPGLASPTRPRDSDQLEIIVVTGAGRPLRKLVAGVTRDRVQAGVRQFLNEVTDPRKTRTQTYLTPAQTLYRWLIQPIEATLVAQGIMNLAVIADAGLRFIPLAALHDGQQFLIEKFSLGLLPSLSLTDTRFVSLQQASVLAMGASEFTHQEPLPAVPTELALITQQLRAGRSFLNQEFTLTNLKVQRQQDAAKIVHLATHGEFRAGALSNSYIQLWDSQLRLDQLRQLGWSHPPVELLVLSACRTALGSEEAELGFAGFAVQAGVKSALASLWNVSDEGTLGLMTEFYRQLAIAPIRAEALRRAQISLLAGRVSMTDGRLQDALGQAIPLPPVLAQLGSRNLRHPYYWSAFTMIGSPW